MEITPDFGYWLAGYLDGEGHFGCNIYDKRRGGRDMVRSMVVNARADDYPLLVSCQSTTGLGNLHFVPAKGASKPNWRWVVASIGDSLKLIDILDTYPLRSKKRTDYEIWKEITLLNATFTRPGKGANTNDWDRMHELIQQLRGCRTYNPAFEKVGE